MELPWASKTRFDIGFCTCLLVNICVPGKILRLAFNELADNLAPGGPVVRNPPCNAGDASLIPGQGTKIPTAAGQLSRLKPT